MLAPIKITDKAIEEIKKIIKTKNIPTDYGLRVGVKGGGCGVSFVLGFDKIQENDEQFLVENIPVFIQKKEMMFLIGKEIDFYDGSDARGFAFN